MKVQEKNTPPSSLNDDEIDPMDEELMNFDEMEEINLEDYDMDEMEEVEYDDEGEDIEPSEDHAFMVFDKHKGAVFCSALHPNGKIAVTGGIDDKAYVWSVTTGEVIMECSDKDSVVFVGFSFDGAYLAIIGIGGLIRVYKCNLDENQQGPWPLVFQYEAGDFIWGLWHFGAKVLFFGAKSGDIFVFKIPTGETKVLQGHNMQAECGKMFHDGRRLAAGYSDGIVKIWDLKSSTVLHQVKVGSEVRDIDVHHDDTLVAAITVEGCDTISGAYNMGKLKFLKTLEKHLELASGTALFLNKRVALALLTIIGEAILITPNNGKIVAQWMTEDDLELVVFSKNPQLDLISLGALNGSLTLWDTATKILRHHCSKHRPDVAFGVTRMMWIKDKIVTARLDASVRAYDARSGSECLVLTGHRRNILDMCYNPKENLILTTSEDGTARLYKYPLENGHDKC